MLNTVGTKNRVAMVAQINPPITARPSGAFCSPPSPMPSAMGIIPMIMASAVISTGRKRVKPASSAARVGSPSAGQMLLGEADHQDAVGGGDADAHDGAHQRGNAQRGARDKEKDHDSGHGGGQRGDDDERIEPGLEIDHDEEVDQDDGKNQTAQQAAERRLHGIDLAANDQLRSARQFCAGFVDDAIDVGGDAAQVAILHVAEDVDGALDVVVRNDGHFGPAAGADDVAHDFGPVHGLAGDGDVIQIANRGDIVLRRLRHQAISHAVLGIEPIGGRGLKASAQGDQQTVGDVELRVAALDGLGAIDVDLNSRQIEELVNAQIHRAGNAAKLAEKIGGESVVGVQVRTGDLNIDGRRQTEVQNLADDVGGQEVERYAGKFARQLAAQLVDVESRTADGQA